ncbi:flavin reductase family protein [Actinophytocola glycyrrhizae]|uniref:Flavin reductase family protein n=1 Tax=Actinophytocola glycyrrhizae TaxID=2044873 RepID=A0ABV9S070_9PSEU
MSTVDRQEQGQHSVPGSDGTRRSPPDAVDHRQRAVGLRDCLGHFATGVTVVTVGDQNNVHGATVNAFVSVSLDPALVMVSLNRRSQLCERLRDTTFGINILAADQQDLGLHFAGAKSRPDVSVEWEDFTLAPRLRGCLGFLACSPWAMYEGGDHVLYVGEVRYFEHRAGEPLVFHGGAFRDLRDEPDGNAWAGSFDDPATGPWQLYDLLQAGAPPPTTRTDHVAVPRDTSEPGGTRRSDSPDDRRRVPGKPA